MPNLSPNAVATAKLPANIVFFDVETSGLSPQFDQITQIAAIRSDWDFSERADGRGHFNFRAKRTSSIVPSSYGDVDDQTLPEVFETGGPECDMMFDAYNLFSAWSPAVFAGFNSVRFDEFFCAIGFSLRCCRRM